jgi:oxygen-independent coproporphyrinogen-3 oxidase
LAAGRSPGHGREVLDAGARRTERVLLELRLSSGLDLSLLSESGRRRVARETADGLLDPAALDAGRAVLTRRGRLLADGIALRLLD